MLMLQLPLTTKTTSAQPTLSDHWNRQKLQLQKGMQLKGQWTCKWPPHFSFPRYHKWVLNLVTVEQTWITCQVDVLAGEEFDSCSCRESLGGVYSTVFISCHRPQDTHSAENKNRSKRKRCEVWGENPKQNDWRRAGDWPVGMKNIGNTCWFSAVIQVICKKVLFF